MKMLIGYKNGLITLTSDDGLVDHRIVPERERKKLGKKLERNLGEAGNSGLITSQITLYGYLEETNEIPEKFRIPSDHKKSAEKYFKLPFFGP